MSHILLADCSKTLAMALLLTIGTTACGRNGETPDIPSGGPHTLVIRMTDDMRFEPAHPSIGRGDTVVWINTGSLPHTSTDEPGRAALPEHTILPTGAEPWDSGVLKSGERFMRVFRTPGDYTYLCLLHEGAGMVGEIMVLGSD